MGMAWMRHGILGMQEYAMAVAEVIHPSHVLELNAYWNFAISHAHESDKSIATWQ